MNPLLTALVVYAVMIVAAFLMVVAISASEVLIQALANAIINDKGERTNA